MFSNHLQSLKRWSRQRQGMGEWKRSDDASTEAKSGRRLDHRRGSIPDCRLGVVEGGRRVRSASDEDVQYSAWAGASFHAD